MAISRRQVTVFVLGILLGGLMVGGAWLAADRTSSPSPYKPDTPDNPDPSVRVGAVRQPGTPGLRERAACSAQPLAAVGGPGDGQFQLQADLSGKTAADVAAFITVGKEAAAAGRPRDAEVAFLMSCQIADKLKGAGSTESADARYQLARHYAGVALQQGSAAAGRPEFLKRSELLYSDSLQSYVAQYGESHEKSRFAAAGLAALRQPSVQPGAAAEVAAAVAPAAPTAATASAVAVVPAAPAAQTAGSASPAKAEQLTRAEPPARAQAPVRAQPPARAEPPARAALPAAREPVAAVRPSFDCAKARSPSEKIICSDAELAQLDRDLGRVYARAKSAASDSAAFKRQNDREWRRREATCRDRACLLDWYAERRNQLMSGMESRDRLAPTAAR